MDSCKKSKDLRDVIKSKTSDRVSEESKADLGEDSSYPFMTGYKVLELDTPIIWFRGETPITFPNLLIVKRSDIKMSEC